MLLQQLAMTTGKLDVQTIQIESLERRAITAEICIEKALERRRNSKKRD
jgi:hypothetical protein